MDQGTNLRDRLISSDDGNNICAVVETHVRQQDIQTIITTLSDTKEMLSKPRKKTKSKTSVIPQFLQNVDTAISLLEMMDTTSKNKKSDHCERCEEYVTLQAAADTKYHALEKELQITKDQLKNLSERYSLLLIGA